MIMRFLFAWADLTVILYQRDRDYCIGQSKST